MKVNALAVALAVALTTPAFAEVPPGYLEETFANGLTVSILPDPAHPVVATQVWYHVGSANEDDRSRGLAHFFEHLMFGETATRSKEDYALYHHRHGGDENGYTSNDETVYVSEIVPGAHKGVLEREADRMINLLLTQENLDNEKRIVSEELRLRTENDPMSRLLVAAQKALLREHPYAFDPTGSKEDIAAATLPWCRSFYENYYRPKNAHLVIVGPVDAERTMADVRRIFGNLPAEGVTPADVPPLIGWEFPQEVSLEEDLPPVEVSVLAFPLPPADVPDRDALDLLEVLLSAGEVDPFRESLVVRRKKAVEAGTEFLRLRRGGAVIFYSASLPYRRKSTSFRLMEEVRAELSEFKWLTPESLAAAKRSVRRRELFGRYFAASRADDIGGARWWLGDSRFAFDADERIRAVTVEEVREAYRKYVGEATPVRLYVRPEKVPILVHLFGWLYPLVKG